MNCFSNITALRAGIVGVAVLLSAGASQAQMTGSADDFYLTLTAADCNITKASNLDDPSDWYNKYTQTDLDDILGSGVSGYIRSHKDRKTGDFGFSKDGYSQFLIIGYMGAPKYIKDVQVEWSFEGENGGALHFYGKGQRGGAFTPTVNTSLFADESEMDFMLFPSRSDSDGKTLYEFTDEIPYIAMIYEPVRSGGVEVIARFKTLTLHFVSELEKEVESAVPEVAPDAGATVQYYDLNGLPVDATSLRPGLYIRRVGSRVEKVVL